MSTNIDKILQDLGTALKNSASAGPVSASRGIVDTATREQLVISDAGVETGNLKVEQVVGNLRVERSVQAPLGEFTNLKVSGKLEAEVLQVKRIVSDQSEDIYSKSISFTGVEQQDLDGKGMLWTDQDYTRQFVFKAEPRRIFSTESIDLYKNANYQIEGINVLEKTRLGNSVVNSNLRTVGTLESLTVSGNVSLGESIYVNYALNRLGINTDQPRAALDIEELGTNLVLGVNESGEGYVGTWANQAFTIITDNTKRISVKGNTTEFGNAASNNAVVKIHGSLEVSSIVSDTRVERFTPIEFLADKDNSIYGKGLAWKGDGITKQLFLMPNPDRMYSSESFDLAKDRAYFINRKSVLSESTLGDTVINSSLTTVGTLKGLSVNGAVDLNGAVSIDNRIVTFNSALFVKDGLGIVKISGHGVDTVDTLNLSVNGVDEFKVNADTVQIGNRDNTARTINAYGKLAVNITNPNPDAAFSVDGLVEISGKKFANGESAPLAGQWSKGDIIWNTDPQETSYIGWVCVMSGSPGNWKPFGYIGAK